jgi:hypothetical protein
VRTVPPVAPEFHFELSLPRLKRNVVFETFHPLGAIGRDHHELPAAVFTGLCFESDEAAFPFVKPHHVSTLFLHPKIGNPVMLFNAACR